MNQLPKDIINYILTFVDTKSYINCLKSFNVSKYNLICEKQYIERKSIFY